MAGLINSLRSARVKDTVTIHEDEEFFEFDVMSSGIAFFYEKVRTFVDYNEEHLLRKNAIYRILKRKYLETTELDKISEQLIKELISARYFDPKSMPMSVADEVTDVISKYDVLFNDVKERHGLTKAYKAYSFIMGLAAVEIEETLVPSYQEQVWFKLLLDNASRRIDIKTKTLSKEELDLQMYLATHRNFFKSDKQMQEYLLLKSFYPSWKTSYTQIIDHIAKKIFTIKADFDRHLTSKLALKIQKATKPMAALVKILKESVEDDFDKAEELLSDEEALEKKTRAITKKKYDSTQAKLKRSIFRSIIYVFITKMVLALAIEVPFDYYVFGHLSYLAISFNILIPPLLMFFIAISIRKPGDSNTQAIVEEINSLVYDTEPQKINIRPPVKRSIFAQISFNAFYVIVFLISFAVIVYALSLINFSSLSIALFLVFLSIVSFFGVRMRTIASELVVEKKPQNFFSAVFEFFTLPFVLFGRWLTMKFSRINIFVFVMDFIIEAPLKLVLEAFNNWMDFLKEKKEEIY